LVARSITGFPTFARNQPADDGNVEALAGEHIARRAALDAAFGQAAMDAFDDVAALAKVGAPHPFFLALMAIELILPPILVLLWLTAVGAPDLSPDARRAASTSAMKLKATDDDSAF
jgi:hypothetical protein